MGVYNVKRILFLIVFALFLSACGNDAQKENESEIEYEPVEQEEQQEEPEVVFERIHDIRLVDNNDLEINLLRSIQERTSIADLVKLEMEIKNKQDKTFEYSFRKIKFDGSDQDASRIGMEVHEVKPNETIEVTLSVYDYEQIEFQEFFGAEFSYNDYSSSIPIAVEKISEYINE